MPKAFVISPIGDPETDERRHADWVLDNIIRKACDRLGPKTRIMVERSDESTMPGPIMNEAINAVIHDRVIFVVLAGDRPNVYYELAIALAAGRPVIILRHSAERTHFDVKDFRAITYDYPMRGRKLAEIVKTVAGFVRRVLKEEAYDGKVFGDLDALGRSFREYEFKPKFRDIDIAVYSGFLHQAAEFIGLQGISLWHFTRTDLNWSTPTNEQVSFFDLIRSKVLFDAVSVRIVMMHPANPALPHHIKFDNPERFAEIMERTRDEISSSFRYWSRLKAELDRAKPQRKDRKKGKLEITQLVHGVVNYRLTVTDRRAIVSPYFNTFTFNSQGATLICAKGTAFYDHVRREFFDRIVSNDVAAIAQKRLGVLEGYVPPDNAA